MTPSLGSFESVDPRTIWKSEASDFTPWLATVEGIGQLAEAIGIELEVDNTEVAVGPYSADVLARDVGTGRPVIVENQLARTDHSHLGQLLTYASALEASAVVWVATDFSQEHQRALDRLNEHTSDELAFYGVRLEVWKIDDSSPALRFNVLSSPPDVSRRVAKQQANVDLTPTRELQLEFWSALEPRLRESKDIPSTQTPRPQYWYDVALGHSDIFLSNTASPETGKVSIRVYLRHRIADKALEFFLTKKTEIEKEIGHQLNWDPNPDTRDKIVQLEREADISNREQWPEILDWMEEHIIKFRKAFASRMSDFRRYRESDATPVKAE